MIITFVSIQEMYISFISNCCRLGFNALPFPSHQSHYCHHTIGPDGCDGAKHSAEGNNQGIH